MHTHTHTQTIQADTVFHSETHSKSKIFLVTWELIQAIQDLWLLITWFRFMSVTDHINQSREERNNYEKQWRRCGSRWEREEEWSKERLSFQEEQWKQLKDSWLEEVNEAEEWADPWHLARDQSRLLQESYTTSPQMEERGVREWVGGRVSGWSKVQDDWGSGAERSERQTGEEKQVASGIENK